MPQQKRVDSGMHLRRLLRLVYLPYRLHRAEGFSRRKGAAFATPRGWFDAGAPFEGTGVIYMKAPFFPAGPCQAVARFSEKQKKAPFLKE